MSWDEGYRSPADIEDERRAAAVAQQRANELDPYQKQTLDLLGRLAGSIDALTATVGRRQPASPICEHCGAEQPIAGRPAISFDARRDRAAERLATRHPERPYLFWAAVVRTVLDEMNWTPGGAGDGAGGSAEPVSDPGSARSSHPQ
ncbi:hypothetical protein [Mycolicibacterium goodii]|uniref:Uncharacterized protein n=1 Tax=Mycobacterium phage Rem711 TaxID=2079285 RepID=A0A2K9VEY3_9CAUD|nr:hypothetical protein [Mycolicibacterium goodii]YP_009964074.1 hypothetical protein I5J35_gp49 [Mycobacterium phage Rem711]AUV60827.1 hypothetical protein SEA_REM711_49 [Mycobacterium phage Rem711]MBU8832368.1 hypothetical protein [Mycolicibacterium goodii]